MTLDNAALSVGPQVVIDKTQIVPQIGGDYKLRPNKIWLRTSTNLTTAQNKPFETFDIPCNQAQLTGIIETAKAFMDEEASMPTIAQGEQGAASQTMGGMSMLFNSANVVFRRVVKSWDDDVTTPTLRRFYDWNMQFNPDPGSRATCRSTRAAPAFFWSARFSRRTFSRSSPTGASIRCSGRGSRSAMRW
jgi:hypothetical protein